MALKGAGEGGGCKDEAVGGGVCAEGGRESGVRNKEGSGVKEKPGILLQEGTKKEMTIKTDRKKKVDQKMSTQS